MKNSQLTPQINTLIVVALHHEARILIERLKLKKELQRKQFELFVGAETALIVTGVGKLNAAVCTALALERYCSSNPLVLNFGLSGAAQETDLEQAFSITKVIDRDSERQFYPEPIVRSPFSEKTLETHSCPVASPEKLLKLSHLVDMEASGVLSAAYRFVDPSRVQLIKVVSDTLKTETFSRDRFEALVAPAITPLLEYVDALRAFLSPEQAPLQAEERELLTALALRLKLSAQQRIILEQEAARFRVRTERSLDFLNELVASPAHHRDEGKKQFQKVLHALTSS